MRQNVVPHRAGSLANDVDRRMVLGVDDCLELQHRLLLAEILAVNLSRRFADGAGIPSPVAAFIPRYCQMVSDCALGERV